MKKNTFLKSLVGSLLFSVASVSSAAIIDNGFYTTDTSTGLHWLDVTETRNRSYNDISGELVSGGEYENWRFATQAEFEGLLINFGFSTQPGCVFGQFCSDNQITDPTTITLMESAIGLLGDTQGAYLHGLGASVLSGLNRGAASGFFEYNGTTNLGFINIGELISKSTGSVVGTPNPYLSSINIEGLDNTRTNSGSFLVSTIAPSVVPVPAAAWLFGSALIGLVGIKRKKA